MANSSISIQTVWWIASKEHQTSIMWSCHIVKLMDTIEGTQKEMKIVLDMWSFWDIKNSNIFDKLQLEKIGNPNEVDVLILSHVHHDHIGNLVSFVKSWYNWPIYMSHTNQPLFLATAYDALSILRKQITDIEEQNKTLGKRLNLALSLVYNISSQKNLKNNIINLVEKKIMIFNKTIQMK